MAVASVTDGGDLWSNEAVAAQPRVSSSNVGSTSSGETAQPDMSAMFGNAMEFGVMKCVQPIRFIQIHLKQKFTGAWLVPYELADLC